MNLQTFKNGEAMYPVSTETMHFIQEQILFLQQLTRTVGLYSIIRTPNGTTDGLAIVAGELLPLKHGTSGNFIEIVETPVSVTAGTKTFPLARIYRYAQYSANTSAIPLSYFTNVQSIATLMARIADIEGSCMTETDIRALVQAVQTNLNTTDGNLSSLTTRVQTIENNYKTAAQITELLNANAQHHLPKGSIFDWYGTADCDHIPYGYVPCGIFFLGSASQFAPDGAGTKELAKWRAKYSGINIGAAAIGSYVGIRIADYNSQTVPDLTDRFIVQAGGSYTLGNTGGNEDGKVTLTEANMPRHKHDVAVNNTGSDHQHRIAWPANAGGDARIDAENYINQGGQGAKGNETYILTHATATNYNGKHTHTVSESYKGSGTAFSIMPPYYALYKLIKVI